MYIWLILLYFLGKFLQYWTVVLTADHLFSLQVLMESSFPLCDRYNAMYSSSPLSFLYIQKIIFPSHFAVRLRICNWILAKGYGLNWCKILQALDLKNISWDPPALPFHLMLESLNSKCQSYSMKVAWGVLCWTAARIELELSKWKILLKTTIIFWDHVLQK